MSVGLAIDAGGSSTRWAVARLGRDGTVLARGAVGPLSGLSFLPGADSSARDDADTTIRTLAAQVHDVLEPASRPGLPPDLQRVLAGVTGTTTGDRVTESVRDAIAGALASYGYRPHVTVVSDLELMHGASFAPGEGILVYAGTGSIAVHRTLDDRWLRAGGHGYLIDDAGGGFSIGHRALRAWMRACDSAVTHADVAAIEARPVYAALERHVGSHDWTDVRAFVYGGGRAAVASLVPVVGDAAAQGDALAMGWIREAGSELARLATVLARRVRHDRGDAPDHELDGATQLPVAIAGGVTHLGEPLLEAIVTALPSDMPAQIASRSPLDAAVDQLID